MQRPAQQLTTYPDARPAVAVGPVSLHSVFRQHAGFVASLAYRLLGRDDELDDVVQDVFLAAVRGIGALRDPEAIRPWLAAVTVRVARQRLRARRLRRWCGFDEAPEYESLAAPGATAEDRALLAQVYRILDGLPVDQRVSWCLRHVHGYPLEQVAEIRGCSLATVKRWIAKAHAEVESVVNHG